MLEQILDYLQTGQSSTGKSSTGQPEQIDNRPQQAGWLEKVLSGAGALKEAGRTTSASTDQNMPAWFEKLREFYEQWQAPSQPRSTEPQRPVDWRKEQRAPQTEKPAEQRSWLEQVLGIPTTQQPASGAQKSWVERLADFQEKLKEAQKQYAPVT
jgi:hypothetical protein